jgi:DNA-binding NtrC family response regulator
MDTSKETSARRTVLVIDDDEGVRTFFRRAVKTFETRVELLTAENLAEARTILAEQPVVLAFVDKCLPDGDGVEFCRELVGRPDFAAYVITGTGSNADCIGALEFGVLDYIPKPLRLEGIRDKIRRHIPVDDADRPSGVAMGRRASSIASDQFQLVGESAAMIQVAVAVHRIAKTDLSALIIGESGTGKEVVAKQIHQLSSRRDKKFVAVNCAAVPDNLIESELFGHEKGAFTDAKFQRVGLFEEAQGGTIFLDEITSTSLDFQVKLLRVLQEGKLRRVGANREISLNVRVIAASNKRMDEEIKAGRFREDLYFRIKGAEIELPRLAEREKDVLVLACYFGDRFARQLNKVVYFSEAVVDALNNYSWPGNVRELESVVEYALSRCNGTVLLSDLPIDVRQAAGEKASVRLPVFVNRTEDIVSLPVLIHYYSLHVLSLCEDNKTVAADKLGCNRKWLLDLLARDARGEMSMHAHELVAKSHKNNGAAAVGAVEAIG